MYKVVLIDDEPIILKGLSRLVPWEAYHCQVAGTAGDGAEGLKLIRQIQPDIVFSDIYMPKMDGLLMAAALKSEFENLELTILTGYRDFDLLQQALRLGVTRYILKPSDMEELEEALKVMIEKLKKKGIMPDREGDKEPDCPKDLECRKDSDCAKDLECRKDSDRSKDPGCQKELECPRETGQREKNDSQEQAGSFLVNSAIAYMKKNYMRKLTLTEVADHIYVSQWHLSKLLNRHGGQSFSELLNTIRVEEAKALLKDPSLRIGDVAEAVGFLDLAHFSRVFKKITGISANEFRNRMNVS